MLFAHLNVSSELNLNQKTLFMSNPVVCAVKQVLMNYTNEKHRKKTNFVHFQFNYISVLVIF